MNTIHEYVYNKPNKNSKNRRVIGVLATSITKDNAVGIGWALCNRTDKFDRARGLEIAKGRAYYRSESTRVPFSIIDSYIKFIQRCTRYYKNSTIVYIKGEKI